MFNLFLLNYKDPVYVNKDFWMSLVIPSEELFVDPQLFLFDSFSLMQFFDAFCDKANQLVS